jgi:hypothetical protein
MCPNWSRSRNATVESIDDDASARVQARYLL